MTKEELDDADEAGLKGDGAESPLVLTKFEGPFRFGDSNGGLSLSFDATPETDAAAAAAM